MMDNYRISNATPNLVFNLKTAKILPMKEFLFLYPVTPFLDYCLRLGTRENRRYHLADALCDRFNDIIEARYRQRGFSVNWLMFSQDDQAQNPDLTLKAEEIAFNNEDRILTSGVSFKRLVEDKQYPDFEYILSQLPEPVDRLVVGGFHQWDCVDMLAAEAYKRGIPTIVDEDTTDVYFVGGSSRLKTPLVRDSFQEWVPDHLLDYVKKDRAKRPWFTQY